MTAPENEGTTAPENEGTTAPENEGTTAPENEGTTAPEDEGTTAPEDEGTTASEDEGTTTPENEGTTASEDKATTASEDEGTTASEDEATTASEDEGTTAPEDTSDADISIGASEMPNNIPEPVHKKGDKVELDADAEYIWIGEEQFSLSDEDATVDLFVEDSEDDYILERTIVVGSSERLDANNKFYSVVFKISKNRWTFDEFEFYTTSVTDEVTYLESKVKEIGYNSCEFTISAPLEEGKNIYLNAVPRFTRNGVVLDDVDIKVEYHGTEVKSDRILTDNRIMLDLRALDEEGSIIIEQKDFTVIISEEDEEEPNEGDSDVSNPDENNSDVSVPDENNSDVSNPDENNSDVSDPDENNSNVSVPDENNSDVSVPDENNSDVSVPDENNSDVSNPDENNSGVSVPDVINPDNNSDVSNPDKNDDEPVVVPVELSADCGNAAEIFFDNINGDTFDVTVTGSPLENFSAELLDAENVVLGNLESSDDGAKIVLSAVRDINGEYASGNVSGKLIITADNAEPLTIELSGHSGFVRIVERGTAKTTMKYMPYWAEYGLDIGYPWLSAEFTVLGELPEGLEFDAQNGKISGAPTAAGTFKFEIAANLTYKDMEDSSSAYITREIELNIANNTAKNLYMMTDPDYGFVAPLGESIDGRAYYISAEDATQKQSITLNGDCSEFYDLWLNGIKLKRVSDDYKMLHGQTLITLEPNAFSGLKTDEINTLVFIFKPNSSENYKYAAQNFIITEDKSAIEPNEEAMQGYLNMYTPTNMIVDDNISAEYKETLSSVRIYASSGNLPSGTKTIVKSNAGSSKYGIAMDISLIDGAGRAIKPEKSLTVQVSLPQGYQNRDVFVYELEDGKYSKTGSTVKDGQLFFTASESKTFVITKVALGEMQKNVTSNPATGIAVSGAGFIASGAALVLILTSKRKK